MSTASASWTLGGGGMSGACVSWAGPLGQFGQDSVFGQRWSLQLKASRPSSALYEGAVYTQLCPSWSLGYWQLLWSLISQLTTHRQGHIFSQDGNTPSLGECDGSRGYKQIFSELLSPGWVSPSPP